MGAHNIIGRFHTLSIPDNIMIHMYMLQCCQNLLTRNPTINEENPGKCIGLMGIGS